MLVPDRHEAADRAAERVGPDHQPEVPPPEPCEGTTNAQVDCAGRGASKPADHGMPGLVHDDARQQSGQQDGQGQQGRIHEQAQPRRWWWPYRRQKSLDLGRS